MMVSVSWEFREISLKSAWCSNSLRMVSANEIKYSEFEEARRCLISSYDSYIQNHTGLLIAVIIGGLALIAEWRNFQVNGYSISIFIGLLVLVGFGFFIT